MADHPFEQPYDDRSASELLAATKLYVRLTISDADEVRNTDLTAQFGGIYVRALSANFNLDTEDTQADDGVDVIIDSAGNHWIRAVDSQSTVKTLITATGNVTIADDDTADEYEINNTSGGPINVYLPSAAVRTKKLTVTDVAGNAATYAITVLPKSGSSETIMTGASWVIDSNGGGIGLTPNSAGTGYK